MDEEQVKKKILKYLDSKYRNSKVIQNYKELFIELMTYSYLAAIHDMESQDITEDIQI